MTAAATAALSVWLTAAALAIVLVWAYRRSLAHGRHAAGTVRLRKPSTFRQRQADGTGEDRRASVATTFGSFTAQIHPAELGEPCARATDWGTERWAEHDHRVCTDAPSDPPRPSAYAEGTDTYADSALPPSRRPDPADSSPLLRRLRAAGPHHREDAQ